MADVPVVGLWHPPRRGTSRSGTAPTLPERGGLGVNGPWRATRLRTHGGRQVKKPKQKRERGSVPATAAPKFTNQPHLVETEER